MQAQSKGNFADDVFETLWCISFKYTRKVHNNQRFRFAMRMWQLAPVKSGPNLPYCKMKIDNCETLKWWKLNSNNRAPCSNWLLVLLKRKFQNAAAHLLNGCLTSDRVLRGAQIVKGIIKMRISIYWTDSVASCSSEFCWYFVRCTPVHSSQEVYGSQGMGDWKAAAPYLK